MNLDIVTQPAKNLKEGRQTVDISAGKSLKIETFPNGEEILNATVPAGKKWTAYLNLTIKETDV